MQITAAHREKFTISFLAIFYVLAFYKFFNGLWLFQAAPYFFVNRFDGTTWLFMQTGIHQWLINNKHGWWLFDITFYSMPLVYYVAYRFNQTAAIILAFCWLIINWFYVQFYTLFPTNSIEGHIAWLLMPVLFGARKLKTFYFLMHGLRYFFLFFFVSAAIWKMRQGGLFNPQQMSGILLMQHADYLVSAPQSWFTQFAYGIIKHAYVGYALYIAATILELAFIIGFFTRRYDSWLIAAFVLFLIMDMFIMRIPYFELVPLVLTLVYSKYEEPNKDL
jgi:hypothetical protein